MNFVFCFADNESFTRAMTRVSLRWYTLETSSGAAALAMAFSTPSFPQDGAVSCCTSSTPDRLRWAAREIL
jgi:hypothetical protein